MPIRSAPSIMAQSININRGERLDLEIHGEDNGTRTPIEDGWAVTCKAIPTCGCHKAINLNPIVSGGSVKVSFDTAKLPRPSYRLEISIDDGNGPLVAPKVNLYIAPTCL